MDALISNKKPDAESISWPELEPSFEIPPYLRYPPSDSKEWYEMSFHAIEHRISWLASRGLRPHPNVLKRRDELIALLGKKGE